MAKNVRHPKNCFKNAKTQGDGPDRTIWKVRPRKGAFSWTDDSFSSLRPQKRGFSWTKPGAVSNFRQKQTRRSGKLNTIIKQRRTDIWNQWKTTWRLKKGFFSIRGKQVILDRDLAQLYGVETKVLNQAVKRNIERFPESFMFKLTSDEFCGLVTNCDRFASLRHSSSRIYFRITLKFQEQPLLFLWKSLPLRLRK